MLEKLFKEEKEKEKGLKSRILKELANKNLEKLEKELTQRAQEEFKKRPRLQHVLFAAYVKSYYSLGKGCKVLVIYKDGTMKFEHRQGMYGSIQIV